MEGKSSPKYTQLRKCKRNHIDTEILILYE
jgi:hypothetical protein